VIADGFYSIQGLLILNSTIMIKKTPSIKADKKRKMFLALPFITLPFITFLFYTLGGGTRQAAAEPAERKGFNVRLPIPKFKEDGALDKMSYYDQAAVDSLKLQEQIKKDPNYAGRQLLGELPQDWGEDDFKTNAFPKRGQGLNSFQDQKEQQVYEKLEALQKIIQQPAVPDQYGQDMREFENYGSSDELSTQIKNLEQQMSAMGTSQQPDPELQQLGGMLENILDIQHPSRVEERLKQRAAVRKEKSFTVIRKKEDENMTLLQQDVAIFPLKANSFYTADEIQDAGHPQNALEAVLHQTQSIVNGSVVKLRLVTDIMLQGILVPKNTFLYGTASLKGERLEITIANIQYGGSIFPVELAVYDLDGMNGIYIPGAINRDVAKASADRSIQTLGLTGVTDSWGAQAAGMGIEAAKSLMSRKVKLVKVVVKAGYRVLLYDEKQKN
jgi:conjugative transposon TraM protein